MMVTLASEKSHQQIALLFSGTFYGISLLCPVFALKEGDSSWLPGFVCLLFGFWQLAWYANPLYFAGLVALREKLHYCSAFMFCACNSFDNLMD
jgi:hypothetical protein